MYYRTDTHWTSAGLSVAATAIVTALGRQATTSATVEQVGECEGRRSRANAERAGRVR